MTKQLINCREYLLQPEKLPSHKLVSLSKNLNNYRQGLCRDISTRSDSIIFFPFDGISYIQKQGKTVNVIDQQQAKRYNIPTNYFIYNYLESIFNDKRSKVKL